MKHTTRKTSCGGCRCCCPCCCANQNRYDVSFYKWDRENAKPVPGAHFLLSNGATAVSGKDGRVSFGALPPGRYTLTETQAPDGFLIDSRTYTIVIEKDGAITADGLPLSDFYVQNTPYPILAFCKYDQSGNTPLAGAVFTLSNGQTAVSDENGMVNFGRIPPGSYTLKETKAPPGFDLLPNQYQVLVPEDGNITVDGLPLAVFSVVNQPSGLQSEPPVFEKPILEGDTLILGYGIAGAAVSVRLPDGLVLTTTVLSNGLWLVPVPTGSMLRAFDVVTAWQQEPGKLASQEVSAVVAPRTSAG